MEKKTQFHFLSIVVLVVDLEQYSEGQVISEGIGYIFNISNGNDEIQIWRWVMQSNGNGPL